MIADILMMTMYLALSIPTQNKSLRLLLPTIFSVFALEFIITSEFWFYLSVSFVWLIPLEKLSNQNLFLAVVAFIMPCYNTYLALEVFLYDMNSDYVTIAYNYYDYILASIHALILTTCIASGVMNGRNNRNCNKRAGNDSAKSHWITSYGL